MTEVVQEPFELTREQREIRDVCRDFAEREIRPVSQAVDEADTETPWELWYKAASLGLTSFMLPEEYGGGGLTDCLTGCVVQEELCWGCSGIGNLITSGGFFAETILELGSDEQKRRWLEPIAGERPPLAALATTEPASGSDAASMQTTAASEEGGYRLRGQKTWVSNGGLARAALEYAVEYAKTREQFGKPIAEHQAVAFRLADMAVRVDAARLLVHRAARKLDAGAEVTKEAAMAKLYASEAAMWCTWAAVQTLGGWGYSREYPVEKWMRDAKLEEIEEGTSDIQRLIISRGVLRD